MQAGPEEFRAIVVAHQSMVYSIALRMLGEPPAAEEVAQDVFLELYRGLGGIGSTEHLVHWLRRVTVHRAADALRRRRLRPEAVAETRTEPWSEEIPLRAGPGGREAMGCRIEQLLQSLPAGMRTAVVLRYQEELTPGEIATLLGQPVATVKTNLQRALVLLRRKAETLLKEYVRA
ncbi:MAG TPA: sigma-70 family RNA polymerase sigma factor [Acidobacteriaceae bacterium]